MLQAVCDCGCGKTERIAAGSVKPPSWFSVGGEFGADVGIFASPRCAARALAELQAEYDIDEALETPSPAAGPTPGGER